MDNEPDLHSTNHVLAFLAVAAGVIGCGGASPPADAACTPYDGGCVVLQQTSVSVNVAGNIKNKVDILFLVDNSASMSAMSEELKNRFDQFFTVFADLASKGTFADLNIGVVTSDYGAGNGAPNCDPSPGGQRGQLQRLGQFAASNCLPPVGANFVHYDFAAGGSNNLPNGQNLVNTFKCMASVGAQGCGFEHQLESVYAALHNDIQENANFLRDDALLAVVFLTNEDDASAPPVTDVFSTSLVAQYGYEDSYSRQTRFAVQCGSPPRFPPYGDSFGQIAPCIPAPNPGGSETSAGSGPGKQYDVSRYIDFFARPRNMGGVKKDPGDVILVGIDAPETYFEVILSNPGTPGGQAYQKCSPLDEGAKPPCVPVLQHSCVNAQQPVFFGDPAVRLNAVIKSVKANHISSICDSDYTGALSDLANLIVSNIAGGCIAGALPDPSMPGCTVAYVTTRSDGTSMTTPIPWCGASGSAPPCWKVETKPACRVQSPQSLGITVDAGDQPSPPGAEIHATCATLPSG